jgi:hypothetical protein
MLCRLYCRPKTRYARTDDKAIGKELVRARRIDINKVSAKLTRQIWFDFAHRLSCPYEADIHLSSSSPPKAVPQF